MRSRPVHRLAALAVAAVLAGCTDAPTAVSPDRIRPAASGGTPLSVYLYCGGSSSYFYCDAYATGGSGSGHTFYWYNASEAYENGASSGASGSIQCSPYDYYYGQTVQVGVTVVDSNNELAQASHSFGCY